MRPKALAALAVLMVLSSAPASAAVSCSRSLPQGDAAKRCTQSDVDHHRRGCGPADVCAYSADGCYFDPLPLCSGFDLWKHNIFGRSVTT